jgi:hypothetical protein
MPDSREALDRLVREVWAEWAREQPDPKPSWLTDWDDLDAGQREVDMRIGETVAAVARAAERERAAMPTLNGVGETERQPLGRWCWCEDVPAGQLPHDCAEDHAQRGPCQADGAHVHPWRGVTDVVR